MCQPHSLHMPLQIQPCSLFVPRLYSARQHTLYEKAAAETFMLCQGNKKSPLCAQIHTHIQRDRVYVAHNGCLPGRDIHCANPCKSIYPKMLSLRTSSMAVNVVLQFGFALGSSCWVLPWGTGAGWCRWMTRRVVTLTTTTVEQQQQQRRSEQRCQQLRCRH